jgi:hypothetical protein
MASCLLGFSPQVLAEGSSRAVSHAQIAKTDTILMQQK